MTIWADCVICDISYSASVTNAPDDFARIAVVGAVGVVEAGNASSRVAKPSWASRLLARVDKSADVVDAGSDLAHSRSDLSDAVICR